MWIPAPGQQSIYRVQVREGDTPEQCGPRSHLGINVMGTRLYSEPLREPPQKNKIMTAGR